MTWMLALSIAAYLINGLGVLMLLSDWDVNRDYVRDASLRWVSLLLIAFWPAVLGYAGGIATLRIVGVLR